MSDTILPLAVWESGTNQNSIPANDNALRLEALSRLVISMDEDSPPGGVEDGNVYIVGDAPSGAWAGFDPDDITIFKEGTWYAWAPVLGLVVNVAGVQKQYEPSSTGGWADIGGGGGGAVASVNGQTGIVSLAADDIPITDTGGFFSSSDIEGALQELGPLLGGSSGPSIGVQYVSDTGSTADSDPGAGLLKWNNASQASATIIYIDDATDDGADMTAMWPALDPNGFLYLQSATDQDVWSINLITSVVDAAGYAKIGVTRIAGNGSFTDADPMKVTFDAGFTAAGVSSVNSKTGAVLEPQSFIVAISDLTTNLATGTNKGYFVMPYNFTLQEVQASVLVAQTAGSILTFDINVNGTTILTTKLTIDNSERTSITAATPPVIASSSIAKGDIVSFDIDQVGTPLAKGALISLIGYPT